MPNIPLFGPSRYHEGAPQSASSRLVNCYREKVGGRSNYILRSVLGTNTFSAFGKVNLQAAAAVESVLYVAAGGYLQAVDAEGDLTQHGSIPDAADSAIDGNNGAVTVTAGGRFFVYDDGAFTEPEPGAFDAVGSHFFLGNFTFLTEKGGRRIQKSGAANPQGLDPLDFVTTELDDSNIVRGLAIGGNAWIFKERAIEIFAISGGELVPLNAAMIEKGLAGFQLITKVPGGAVFVATDGTVYMVGQGATPISTPFVEESIRRSAPTHVFFYEDGGHKHVVLRFSDRPAWCYDLASGEWHERAYGRRLSPWNVVGAVQAYGMQLGITSGGDIYKLQRNNADVGAVLLRRAIGSADLEDGWKRIPELTIRGESGADSTTFARDFLSSLLDQDDDRILDHNGDPIFAEETYAFDEAVSCRVGFSRDEGRTWAFEREEGFGALGDYEHRCTMRGLGAFRRSMTVRLDMTDPVDTPVDCNVLVRVA